MEHNTLKFKLAVIVSHPIQYYVPVFELFSKRKNILIKVFYTLGKHSAANYDVGFKKQIEWDIPLLSGYEYEFLENISPEPGYHHAKGIINDDAIKKIDNYHPDALLVYGWFYHSHLRILKHFKNRIPTYFRGDSNLLDDVSKIRFFLRLQYLKWVYNYIDFAFYVGKANKQYFIKAGLKERQLIFAPHAVDNTRFAQNRHNEAMMLRKNMSLNQDDILILFAGKYEQKKNPLLLLQAFLAIKNPKVHLLFTGDGELEAALKSVAKDNVNIHFLGFKNQSYMPVIYQSADLFCLPSMGPAETWGLAVNEAMAAGKAVLISDRVGCAMDLVKDSVNGKVFKSTDLEDLILSLEYLTNSKQKLVEMGKASSEIIRTWSLENQVTIIENKLLNC